MEMNSIRSNFCTDPLDEKMVSPADPNVQLQKLFELGYSLIPLAPGQKRPFEKNWQLNSRKGLAEVLNQYGAGCNIGCRLGKNSKLTDGTFLAAIDCDVKSTDISDRIEMEEALDELIANWRSAPAVLSGRGNGSKHIHVRTSNPLRPQQFRRSEKLVRVRMPSVNAISSREKVQLTPKDLEDGWRLRPAWEISVMGTGQQVVLPPSVHPDTGNSYEWEKFPVSCKHIPLVQIEAQPKPDGRRPMSMQPGAFIAADVDIRKIEIPSWARDLIISSEGLERYNNDRSSALLAVTYTLINAGLTDMEIMSILTDPEYSLASTSYDHCGSNNRVRAASWLYKYTICKARYEKSAEKAFGDEAIIDQAPLSNEESLRQEDLLLGDWRTRLALTKDGAVKSNLANVSLILDSIVGEQIFSYDLMSCAVKYSSHCPPWSEVSENTSWSGKSFSDIDISRIKIWFAQRFRIEPSTENIRHAIADAAARNPHHPIREFLASLKWDGISRLDTWLEKYFGATGNREYLREVGRKFMCASVRRVMEPGCKWDQILIIEGRQGLGKSRAVSILGGAWYTDTLGDIRNKDAVEVMLGKWFVEIPELVSMSNADVESFKKFASTQVDRVRRPYKSFAEDHPRQCVLVGTTNKMEYLRDDSGNRRFWPVSATRIDLDILSKDRDQLFAEAFAIYKSEFLDLESDDARSHLRKVHLEKFEDDSWAEQVWDALQKERFSNNFSLSDLWQELAFSPQGIFHQRDQRRLGAILRKFEYESKSSQVEGRSVKRWFKKPRSAATIGGRK